MIDPDREHALLFGVQRSVRYHERRLAWFEAWHNITMVLAVFATSGTAVTVQLQNLDSYSTLLTLTAGILLATNVVLGLSRRAAHHQQLKAQFMDLERKLHPVQALADEACCLRPATRFG